MNKLGGRNQPRKAHAPGGGGVAAKRAKKEDSDDDQEFSCEMEDDPELEEAMCSEEMAGEAMEEGPVLSDAQLEAKWVRPEVTDEMRNNKEDMIFQQIEIDHYIGEKIHLIRRFQVQCVTA